MLLINSLNNIEIENGHAGEMLYYFARLQTRRLKYLIFDTGMRRRNASKTLLRRLGRYEEKT